MCMHVYTQQVCRCPQRLDYNIGSPRVTGRFEPPDLGPLERQYLLLPWAISLVPMPNFYVAHP